MAATEALGPRKALWRAAREQSQADKPEADKPEADKPEADKPEADKPRATETWQDQDQTGSWVDASAWVVSSDDDEVESSQDCVWDSATTSAADAKTHAYVADIRNAMRLAMAPQTAVQSLSECFSISVIDDLELSGMRQRRRSVDMKLVDGVPELEQPVEAVDLQPSRSSNSCYARDDGRAGEAESVLGVEAQPVKLEDLESGSIDQARTAHYRARAAAQAVELENAEVKAASRVAAALAPFRELADELCAVARDELGSKTGLPQAAEFDPDTTTTEAKALAALLRSVFFAYRGESTSTVEQRRRRSPSASPIASVTSVLWSPEPDLKGKATTSVAASDELIAENRMLRAQLASVLDAVDELRSVPDPSAALEANYKVLADIRAQETELMRAVSDQSAAAAAKAEMQAEVVTAERKLATALESARTWGSLHQETAANLLDLSNKYKRLKVKHNKLRAMYTAAKARIARQGEVLMHVSHSLDEHEARDG